MKTCLQHPISCTRPRVRRDRCHGFTLLEVMVAIMILGLSLAAIYGSEAGAAKMVHRSRKMGLAALLVRCKMAEIEEQIAEEGLPAIFASGSDECCEEAEQDGFECEWEVHRIELPEEMFFLEEDEEGGPLSEHMREQGEESDPFGIDALQEGGDPVESLLGGTGDTMGELAAIGLPLIYPALKAAFEDQIRRVTVKISWREGEREQSFDVTQYLVANESEIVVAEEGEETTTETQ